MSAPRVYKERLNRNYGAAEAEAAVSEALAAAGGPLTIKALTALLPWADYQAVYRALRALEKDRRAMRGPGATWRARHVAPSPAKPAPRRERWTPERLQDVARRLDSGESASQIAAKMGVTRNAIVGVILRARERGECYGAHGKRDLAALLTDSQLLAILHLRERDGRDFAAIGAALRVPAYQCQRAYNAIIAAEKCEEKRA